MTKEEKEKVWEEIPNDLKEDLKNIIEIGLYTEDEIIEKWLNGKIRT